MKLIKYIFALGVVSLSMTACEDWLEENPKYSMDNIVIFDSQETAEQALDACYGYLTTTDCFGQGLYEVSVGGSGLSWCQTNGSESDRYASLNAMPAGDALLWAWRGLYKTIQECNSFIVNMNAGTLSDELKVNYTAQASFIRGLCYYYLSMMWGDVPLRIEPSSSDAVSMGKSSFTDVVKQIFIDWKYAYDGLFKYGVDAWWCDCSEPIDSDWRPGNISADDQRARYEGNLKALTDLLGPLDVNTYSLHHSKGVYENQRKCTEEKRVVNLTRSSWAGQQRYGTISWNGDTSASWESFAQQIPAGLNFMATGYPYWTVDAGAFFTAGGNEWFRRGVFPQGYKDAGYREFYSRMLQYCTFLPIFRSHGTGTPREPWFYGKEGEPFYESIMTSIKTRYRLLPYIYSLAGSVYLNDYTMTRALAFDFRKDTAVYDIKDEFMFGTSILVCPVTRPMYYLPGGEKAEGVKKCRNVYLPKDGEKNKSVWYDFWSGKEYKGGTTVEADAPEAGGVHDGREAVVDGVSEDGEALHGHS